jgi:hypothetical protein
MFAYGETAPYSPDAVTMCLEKQKNGHKNAILHHTSSGNPIINLATSIAILIHAMQHLPPDTPMGLFWDINRQTQQVTASYIRSAIHIGMGTPCPALAPTVSNQAGQCT